MITNKTAREFIIAKKLFPGGGSVIETDTASGNIANFETNIIAPLVECVCNINPIQTGTGDPSPSNPRPIVPTTTANVVQTGANLWDEQWELGDINSTTGETMPSNYSIRSKNFIPCKPETSYYKYIGNSKANCIYYYDINQNFLSRDTNGNSTSRAITTPTGCYYMKFATYSTYGTTYLDDMAINYPSTDTAYHAYTATTHEIDFGTVYGGELNVTTGVLTITLQELEMPQTPMTTGFVYIAANSGWAFTINNAADIYKPNGIGLSKTNVVNSYDNMTTSGFCKVGVQSKPIFFLTDVDSGLDSTATTTQVQMAFRNYVNNNSLQAVYELATPTEVQLTPQAINSLEGVNNVWHDGNGNISVTYQKKVPVSGGINKRQFLPLIYGKKYYRKEY